MSDPIWHEIGAMGPSGGARPTPRPSRTADAFDLFDRTGQARTVGIAVSIFDLLLVPFGTIFGIYSLCVLLPKATQRLFTPTIEPAFRSVNDQTIG